MKSHLTFPQMMGLLERIHDTATHEPGSAKLVMGESRGIPGASLVIASLAKHFGISESAATQVSNPATPQPASSASGKSLIEKLNSITDPRERSKFIRTNYAELSNQARAALKAELKVR
jgi:hypothetical protein